jgi:hypothetical protein
MTIPDDVLTSLPPLPLSQIEHRVRDGDVLLCSATDLG